MRPSLKTNLLDAIIFIGNSSRIDVLNTAASVTESDRGRLSLVTDMESLAGSCFLKIAALFAKLPRLPLERSRSKKF
jgi:hypothetical protein